MQTIIFEVIFYDGRKFNVFCQNKSQIQRFKNLCAKLENEIEHIIEQTKGIHTIPEFEKLTVNINL